MKEFIKVMKALSDSSRVKVLKMLQQRMLCVCEIQAALGLAQSTTSKHLKLLENAGLVVSSRDGLWINYRLSDGAQSEYAARQIDSLEKWLEDDPQIVELVNKLPQIRRETILNPSKYCTQEVPHAARKSTQSTPKPKLFEILKLLPKTNCKACGEPTCMVFAARVAEGAKGSQSCTELTPDARSSLDAYLGRFHFSD
ncbi:MAG: metalloregulator ArsR/SmtB family transcription factor [Deltaproteobacteria bacterium]|jgi:ArsR family transcriptional regulator, arsenate/arsenite/antimonite-responsive transcriptional repressor